MPDFWTLLSAPFVDLLGWTLLHFVWQGALVAALLAGALRVLQHHGPRVRYAVSCAALLGLLVLPVGTGLLLSKDGDSGDTDPVSTVVLEERIDEEAHSAVPATVVRAADSGASSWQGAIADRLEPAVPWIVFGWGVGVLLLSLRLAGGAWRVRWLRRSGRPVPAEWRDRVRRLADQMGLRQFVALRQSPHVESPMVSGWWRPVVFVPAGFLTGFPPAQVEALLRHELAHVRRHDVLVGRLQAVVETLLFFHPATWWVSRQVRRTREACCDALAVAAGSDRTVYAKALAALAEQAVGGAAPAWTPAAADGSLLGRIRRLLSPPSEPSAHVQRLSMAAAVLLVVGVPLGLAACASQQSATDADGTGDEATVAEAPLAPPAPEAEEATVGERKDSTGREVPKESDNLVEGDSLEEGVYVFREGGRIDTLDWPDAERLERDLQFHFDPDSLERALRRQINPDSLERALRMRFDADSLEHAIRADFNPDSLERALRARINPDSLERALRRQFDPDSLKQQALWMQEGAFHPDSLARGHTRWTDSLAQSILPHADSLGRRLDSLQLQWEQEMPERLREQARHLREQAERLEERAEEMERPAPPEEPTSPSN